MAYPNLQGQTTLAITVMMNTISNVAPSFLERKVGTSLIEVAITLSIVPASSASASETKIDLEEY